jgi:hypothetical protein
MVKRNLNLIHCEPVFEETLDYFRIFIGALAANQTTLAECVRHKATVLRDTQYTWTSFQS